MRAFPRIEKVMLIQPNFYWTGKRTWKLAPYGLGIINAFIKNDYDSWIYDPNFHDIPEEGVRRELRDRAPDVVGITTFSTEYIQEWKRLAAIIREELPDSVIVLGGIYPTVAIRNAVQDPNIDFFVMGEGEYRFRDLLHRLNRNPGHPPEGDGIAYMENGNPVINPPLGYITDLDALPFPDYRNMDIADYGNQVHKYDLQIVPRQFPYTVTMTSRGCPYRCNFCSSKVVSGRRVRLRSAENVLREIDLLYSSHGIREFIFLDDHFLADLPRAEAITRGLIERNYDLTWKCGNVTLWRLDERLLDLMRQSGCYQMTISPESGNQEVLDRIIHKPVRVAKLPDTTALIKKHGFELVANFIIGFPGESWDQIRDSIRMAEKIDADMVNFHIATPLPGTELMETCIKLGLVKSEDEVLSGYTKGVISTDQFTPFELQVLRAFEWDRINFSNEERKAVIARMEGITMEELENWRVNTRRQLGVTSNWKTIKGNGSKNGQGVAREPVSLQTGG